MARSPITSSSTEVSAAAKQQHQYNDNQDQFHGKPPLIVRVLFSAHRILQSAECILHLASGLLGLAFNFQILIAQNLSGSFFSRLPWTVLLNL